MARNVTTRATFDLPKQVLVTDVVARDGFQNEVRVLPTAQKVRVIEGLVRAGVTSIEVTSFVHPSIIPQLADASELMRQLPSYPGVVYSALVPNLAGARRALDAGLEELHLVLSASEDHNQANLNRSVAASLAQLAEVTTFVRTERPQVRLVTTIATAFHCPFSGRTAIERVAWICAQLAALGIDQISLADTDGAAHPLQIWQSLTTLRSRFAQVTWSLHLHNTRDMGLANVLAGLQAGITRFDASLGGIGGCPFVPNATGNIATEDLVHMLREMGIATGIDLDMLLVEAEPLRALVGHDLASSVAKAGPSSALHLFEGVAVAATHRSGKEHISKPI